MRKPTKSELKVANTYEGLVDAFTDYVELPWDDYNDALRKAFVQGMRYQKAKSEKRAVERVKSFLIRERKKR